LRSRSVVALLGLAFAFLLLGLACLRWELISLTIPLAMLLFFAFFLNRPPIIDLGFERVLESDKAQKGDEVQVELRIENKGERLDYVEMFDEIPPGAVVVEGKNRFPLSLERGEKVSIRYKIRLNIIGNYVFGGLTVRWWEPTFTVSKEVTLAFKSALQVIPRIHDLKKCGLKPTQVRMHFGNVGSTSLGPGTEFFCLREYTPGDELRRINWKCTARRDQLMVNEYQMERSGDVVIVVDARTNLPREGDRNELVDHEVEAAASLASYLLKERNRVGLLILGETMETAKLAYGKRQFYRIVDKLLKVQPGMMKSTVSIPIVINRFFPLSSLIVVITPLEDKRIIESVEVLASKGHEVIVISVDTYGMRTKGDPRTEGADLSQQMHQIYRRDLLSELGRNCRIMDWDTTTSLSRYFMEGRAWASRERR